MEFQPLDFTQEALTPHPADEFATRPSALDANAIENIINGLTNTHITSNDVAVVQQPVSVVVDTPATPTPTNPPTPTTTTPPEPNHSPSVSASNLKTTPKKNLIIKPSIRSLLINTVNSHYTAQKKKNIWQDSPWKYIAKLENDYVGKVGESFIQSLCDSANIPASIDGLKTKCVGGGQGDGTIKGFSVEIKTARLGTSKSATFQHELGEKPWLSNFMIFVDIAPDTFYITIMPNFTEEQYKSGAKCEPYFPTKSFTWRKLTGAFKFDTTKALNETQSKNINPFTFKWTIASNFKDIYHFINRIIH